MGELALIKAISPSQLNTAGDCLRKWGLESLDGRKGVDKPSAILGGQTHTQGENWFNFGTRPADTLPGKIFESGIHHWPQPGSRPFLIEDQISFTADGISFHGRLDIAYVDDEGYLVIGDHKTTSDKKWAKTSSDLEKDPQGIIYPVALMARYGVRQARLRWVYYLTGKTRKSWPVTLDVTWEQATERFAEHILPLARILWKAKKDGARGLDMPQNPNACEKFGGCAFRGECNLTPIERMKAIMTQFDLNAQLARSGQQQQGYQQQASQVPALPQPEHPDQGINPPNRNIPGGLLQTIQNQQPQQPQYQQPPPGAPSLFGQNPQAQQHAPPPNPWGALPPAQPAPSTSALASPGPQQAPQGQSFQGFPQPAPMPGPGQWQNPQQPAPQQNAPVQQQPQYQPAPGQYGPPGHQYAPQQAPQQQAPAPIQQPVQQTQPQNAPPAVSRETQNAPMAPHGSQVQPPDVLCVDCMPGEAGSKSVESLCREVNEAVSKAHNVPDYRCVEFGKGPGYFVAAFESYVDRANLPGTWVLDSGDPTQRLVLGIMARVSRKVYRGTR